MSSACRVAAVLAFAWCAFAADLRVCADPDNLPYSNSRGEGFENELARFIAGQEGRTLKYFWVPQRDKYFKSLAAGACDLVMEVPAGMHGVLATRPYFRSTYVFVSRRNGGPAIQSFDDPRLKNLRIGVQFMGDDGATAPPASALAARGMIQNVTWYRMYQNYIAANHPAALIEAVEEGDVDVAIAWGPLAGYFVRSARVPLVIHPVAPQAERSVTFAFDISMGVRQGDTQQAAELNAILQRGRVHVVHILNRYGIPMVARGQSKRPSIR